MLFSQTYPVLHFPQQEAVLFDNYFQHLGTKAVEYDKLYHSSPNNFVLSFKWFQLNVVGSFTPSFLKVCSALCGEEVLVQKLINT